MRKLIFAVILLAASSVSHAGSSPFCEKKYDARERYQCYEMVVPGGWKNMTDKYNRYLSQPGMTEKDKDALMAAHKQWRDAVAQKCGNDAICTYHHQHDRNTGLEIYLSKRRL